MLKREADSVAEPAAKQPKIDVEDARAERERLRLEEKARKEAERIQAKQEREEKRLAEKARKEQERLEERQRRDAEREAKKRERDEEKSRKEAEREAEKAKKEAEREAEKARREAEKEAEKARKEAEKEAEKARKEAEKRKEEEGQLKINTFFKAKPLAKATPEPEPDCDYDKLFLPYHQKANSTIYPVLKVDPVSPEDTLAWLRNESFATPKSDYLSADQLESHLRMVTEAEMPSLLAKLDIRHIQFAENLRPPYVGTIGEVAKDSIEKLYLNPSQRLLDLNYDYDSDYEWFQEEDDGEDLGDDDGSEEDEGDDDMDEFVTSDDEAKRLQITGPLTPLVVWNSGENDCLSNFTVEFLLNLPIDPMKDYWAVPKEKPEKAADAEALSPEATKALLLSVHGRKMNQTLLVELLKQEFPQVPKTAILATVRVSAKRLGGKEPDKKWVVNEDLCDMYEIPRLTPEPTPE